MFSYVQISTEDNENDPENCLHSDEIRNSLKMHTCLSIGVIDHLIFNQSIVSKFRKKIFSFRKQNIERTNYK